MSGQRAILFCTEFCSSSNRSADSAFEAVISTPFILLLFSEYCRALAGREKRVKSVGLRVPANGMGSGLSRECLQRLQALVVDHADDSRRSDGHVQASRSRIVHYDVGLSRQCDSAAHCSAIAIQRNQCPAIGRTKKPL